MAHIKKYVYSIVLTIIVLISVSCVDKSLCYFHFESISQPNQWTEADSLFFNFSLLDQQKIAIAQSGSLMWKLEATTSTDYLFNIISVETTRVCDSICQVDTIDMHIITDKLGTPIKHWGSQRYMSSDSAFLDWKADTIRKVIVRPLITSISTVRSTVLSDSLDLQNDSLAAIKHYTGITDIGLSVQRLVSEK